MESGERGAVLGAGGAYFRNKVDPALIPTILCAALSRLACVCVCVCVSACACVPAMFASVLILKPAALPTAAREKAQKLDGKRG